VAEHITYPGTFRNRSGRQKYPKTTQERSRGREGQKGGKTAACVPRKVQNLIKPPNSVRDMGDGGGTEQEIGKNVCRRTLVARVDAEYDRGKMKRCYQRYSRFRRHEV